MEQQEQYRKLSECANALEGILMDLSYAYDAYMDAMENSPDADYDLMVNMHQVLGNIKDRMESRADEARPMRTVRIVEKVTFTKEVEVPAGLCEAEVDEYLADHE